MQVGSGERGAGPRGPPRKPPAGLASRGLQVRAAPASAPRPSRQAQPHPSLAGLSLAGPLELGGQGERLQAGILFVCSQSTVCEKIMELLGQNEVDHRQRKLVILSQDRFYKVLTTEQKAKALKGQYTISTIQVETLRVGREWGRRADHGDWVQGWTWTAGDLSGSMKSRR